MTNRRHQKARQYALRPGQRAKQATNPSVHETTGRVDRGSLPDAHHLTPLSDGGSFEGMSRPGSAPDRWGAKKPGRRSSERKGTARRATTPTGCDTKESAREESRPPAVCVYAMQPGSALSTVPLQSLSNVSSHVSSPAGPSVASGLTNSL